MSPWSQQAELVASRGDSGDRFGESAALSADGTTALIGAAEDEDPNGPQAGSAYVFVATNGTWTQQAKLIPDDGDKEDRFGWSVGISADGSTALIGADRDESSNGKEGAGSAYVFETRNGSWTQQTKLTAEDGARGDFFGGSVAVENTTACIGASSDTNTNGDNAGVAYLFFRSEPLETES